MARFGYALSSEEHHPQSLVKNAARAEDAGFDFAVISDHYHPWTDRQGHSPFVWSVIGGIAQSTDRIGLGTGVTCPTVRIPPAIVAQAAATAAAMMPGRFFLGVGTGEALNEHVLGDAWPAAPVRREMLEEAVQVIRELWQGKVTNHSGRHYTVDRARIYTLPDEPPPVYVAAAGPAAAKLAGRIGDGFVGLAPQREIVETFEQAGGDGKPRFAQVEVCWDEDEATARRTAHEWWPNTALSGEIAQVLPAPAHFEQAAETVREDDVAEKVVCGSDPDRHAEQVEKFLQAGYDHVYVHQIGPRQEEFIRFWSEQVLPRVRQASEQPVERS
jgi:coenzyme F420-dependent glucose-6-phosphate dehydrogenase